MTTDPKHVEVVHEKNPFRGARMFHLGFFKKYSLHVALFILFTGIILTGIMYHQFRARLFEAEFNSAFTVYSATANLFAGHYFAPPHRDYVPRTLDRHLGELFLFVPEDAEGWITHRPQHVVWYDNQGAVLYEFMSHENQTPAEPLSPDDIPDGYRFWHAPDEGALYTFGPLTHDRRVPGYLLVSFPTDIQDELYALLTRSLAVLLGVAFAGILFSVPFTRQLLAPVRMLTRAAHKAHLGDLDQRVPVVTQDEIGELSETFNEMMESLSKRIGFMHRLQEWTIRIGSQLDAERLYGMLLDMFTSMSNSGACRLYLYNESKNGLDVQLECGAEQLPDPDRDELTKLAFQERWATYIRADGNMDSEPVDALEVAIPMLSGKHRIGVVRIGPNRKKECYTDESLTILQTLAQQASIAIDNANLYRQLELQKRIEQEMNLARKIQISMLPREAPDIPGYELAGGSAAAYEVGGDYYDYVKNNRNWHVIIGDVSGKGMPAALIMTIVRALVHTYLEFESSPRNILRLVNRSISRDLDAEMFVTLSSVQLDPENHELRISRAGHEPLMILRGRNGEVENIAPKGAAMGMLDVEDFEDLIEEAVCALDENDTALLYTDGITEALNDDHEEYGYERLEAVTRQWANLPVSELYEKILEDVKQFSNNTPQHDDITLVIFRRLGGPASPPA